MGAKTVLYHVGNLARDRCRDFALDRQAYKMWKLYQEGVYTLVQKRRYPNVCEYWAVPVKKAGIYDRDGI